MIAYRGHRSFRQYLPAKPTKYGIKVSVLTSMFILAVLQLWKPRNQHALGKKTVLKLTEKLQDKHYHVSITMSILTIILHQLNYWRSYNKEKLTVVELLIEMIIAKSKVNDFQCELSESF